MIRLILRTPPNSGVKIKCDRDKVILIGGLKFGQYYMRQQLQARRE